MIKHGAIALVFVSALGISAASAGPMPIGASAVKSSANGPLTEVRWRGGRGWGPAVGFGIAAGALAGAAVAARPYYGPDYYDAPVYGEPYAYEPVYPAPSYGYYGRGYGYGQCYTDEGNGRRRPCDAN